MKVTVGIDGSSQALVGAEWLSRIPLQASDEVRLASVVQRPILVGRWGYMDTAAIRQRTEVALARAERAARVALEEAVAALEGLPCLVWTDVSEGHPLERLIRMSSESHDDLLIVGPHGRGRIESILVGSVTQGLLHAMPTSVLVARGPVRAPTRVLLAADGSDTSVAAAEYLARFPLPTEARVDVVTVASGGDLDESRERAHAEQVATATVELLVAGGKTASPILRHGDVKRQILSVADENHSDLIILGARGLGGFSGLVLGSVSRALSKAARVPVLVVPRSGADDPGR